MSPRAAWRLTRFGFDVADYAGGKMNWLNHGRPYEGETDLISRHLSPAPSCSLDEKVGDVRARLGSDAGGAVVVDGDLVLGTLPPDASDERTAEEAMVFGVTTVRPSEMKHELDERMDRAGVRRLVVTTPAAGLLGVYQRTG